MGLLLESGLDSNAGREITYVRTCVHNAATLPLPPLLTPLLLLQVYVPATYGCCVWFCCSCCCYVLWLLRMYVRTC